MPWITIAATTDKNKQDVAENRVLISQNTNNIQSAMTEIRKIETIQLNITENVGQNTISIENTVTEIEKIDTNKQDIQENSAEIAQHKDSVSGNLVEMKITIL